MTEEEKTTATLPSDVTDFLGMGQERTGGYDTLVRQPSFGGFGDDVDREAYPGAPYTPDYDTFTDQSKKERRARFKASVDMLFSTDVSKLDDAGASALYQSVTEGLFGLPDEDGSVAFGKRASKDPRANIDMLRKFVKGEYSLIEDPEYTKWREMDDEAKFQYALANETTGNMVKSKLKSERGTNPLVAMAAGDMMSAGYAIPWTDEQRKSQEIDRKWREDAIRNSFYDSMDEEKKAAYRADVIGDYEEKLSRRQTLATFLQFAHGLSDRAGYLLAKSFSDGSPDAANIEGLPEDERDRVYAAFSLMRGDQKKGRILGIQTDFTDDTVANRLQLGLYGFQQSVVGLVTDTGEMARDAAMWTYAKCAMDEAERKAFFKGWDANVRAEQAMKQNLPEADSIFGEAFQGLAENMHWFIPYSLIGKGGKMVNAARGFKEGENALKGWKKIFQPLKDLKVTLTPMRLGGDLKKQKAGFETSKAIAEANVAATRAAYTLDINGVKKLGEYGSSLVARQMAAVDRFTQALRGVDADLKAAKWWKDATGTAMWAAGEASAFSAFASEYIANADAAGISREESVLTAAAIGLVNAKIEQLYVPGLESSLTPAQIKSLTFAAMAQAVKTDGAAGFRKWLANRVSKGVTEGVKVTLTEGAVEEPLQQMAAEHGKAFDKLCQELRKDGKATLANEAKALWDSFAATLPNDYATFIDTAADMVPSSLGFGVTTIGNQTRRQHIHNALTRHMNRRAGAEATDTMFALAQRGEDPSKAVDYDAGLVDVIQQAVNVRAAVEKHWQGEKDGGEARNPHRFEEAITAARRAWRDPQTGDAVQEIADAAGVDVKTAEVLAQYLQTEAEAAAFSPQARAWTALNMSLADIDEATIKTVLPGYVEGSFASDPENGIYSGRVRMDDGTEKTIAYRVGDLSAELVAEAQNMAKADSSFGKSFDARHAELGDGVTWASLSDSQRYAEAVRSQASVNGFSTGKSGVFELTDASGEKVRVNADDVIYLANGRIGDVGYGPAATQGTVRHETFHSLWRFVRATLEDADVQQLAKTLGVDVTKDGWEVELDEKMAHEMERYASGHYVSHAVSSRFDKMLDSWAGKIVNFFGKFGPSDEVTDPKTGKPYLLKGLYDSILRGELGSGALGVELRKVPARPTPDGVRGEAPSVVKSAMPVEVTDADRAAQEAEMRAEAKEEESPTAPTSPAPTVTPVPPPAPVQAATAENPADASTPNQVYYRVGLPNSPVKLVGRLEVRDASTGVITSTDADYHDRGNQNRDDKSEESRALVEKIGANPDPLQVGTVQPIASNGIIWMLPNGDVIIGNHRVNGVRLGYAKGTTAELEKFVREDAAKRGIEIGADVKKPLMVFVLERIESPDGKADVHEVVRLANESQNRGFNVREQAGNDAKILADNNLLPRMEFRADGRIDETKSGDAIGKFRQESGAQGLIAEDGSLTEEGQTRIQNAALAVLLGGEGNNALLNKIMTNAGRLGMQGELRALMKMTPELMALAESKPAYDLRAPLAEALQLFTEWRDKDETARVEKGKTRHDWRETKDGRRVRGLSWEAYLSQGDMFRAPSDEAKILGDLFAKAESLRSFDREDVESAAGKKRVIDLISDYLADYIANARAVNTETDDMFGGSPASRADVLAAQRATGGADGGPRFSVSMRETLDPAAWGDFSRKVKVVSRASAPWKFRKGAKTAEAKKEITALAVENIKAQHNYVALPNENTPALQIGKVLFKIPTHNLFHGADRRLANNGPAAAVIGDVLNASVEVPNVEAPWHYRIAKINFGEPAFVLITAKESGGSEEIVEMQTLYSVNVKADATAQTVTSTGTGLAGTSGAARELNHTDTSRPTEVSISNLRAAWQGAFLQNLVKHNIDSVLKDKNAPVARQREAVIEKYKGTAEWLMAPNGVKSNLDENQWVTVRTPAFKRWFGDWEKDPAHASKIVNENGEPLVVYRGAQFDPLAQEPGKGVIKPEAYFTADPKYARRYGNVRAYYLNIRNPFDVRRPECLADLKKIYPDHEFQRGKSGALDWAEAATVDGEFLRDNFGDKYDGVIYDEGGDPGESGVSYRGISYVPLDGGAQVKLAIENNGDFSSRPDVRYSLKAGTASDYSWATLTSKPDMPLAQIDPEKFRNYTKDSERIADARRSIVEAGGRIVGNEAVIEIEGSDVIVGADGIKHRGRKRNNENDMLFPVLGEVMKNAVRVNELDPRADQKGKKENGKSKKDDKVTDVFVYLGAFAYGNEVCPVRIQISQFEGVKKLDRIDVLKSLNTKIGRFASPANTDFGRVGHVGSGPVAHLPDISIANLVRIAQPLHPEIFSRDVAAALGVPYEGRKINARYSIAGRGGAERLGLKGAAEAEAMEKAGSDREDIWRTTGWWRGRDGQWRVEIPQIKMKDERALYSALIGGSEGRNITTLGEIMDAPELFRAYPQLKDTKIVFSPEHNDEAGGWYDRIKNEIVLFDAGLVSLKDMPSHERDLRDTYQRVLDSDEFVRHRFADMDAFGIEHGTVEEEREYARWWIERQDKGIARTNETKIRDLANDRGMWSTFGKIIHEVQHTVQRIEGFATGASGNEDGYSRFAGEVEARNASRREAMSPEERAATPPWETEDVPADRQIVRYSIRSFSDGTPLVEAMQERERMANAPRAPQGESPFFAEAEGAVEIPIRALRTVKDEQERSIANARRYMEVAAAGRIPKRAPVSVVENGDGTYTVIDGNATTWAAARGGLETVRAKIVGKDRGTRLANSHYLVDEDKSGCDADGKIHTHGLDGMIGEAAREKAYEQAGENAPRLKAVVDAAAKAIGGEALHRKSVKKRQRVDEKATIDYNGDYSRVVDLIGGTLILDPSHDMADALKAIRKNLPQGASVAQVKKMSSPDAGGYWDVKVSVRFANGGIGEIIVVDRNINDAKFKRGGHDLYDIQRILDVPKAETSSDLERLKETLKKLERAIYSHGTPKAEQYQGEAWESLLNEALRSASLVASNSIKPDVRLPGNMPRLSSAAANSARSIGSLIEDLAKAIASDSLTRLAPLATSHSSSLESTLVKSLSAMFHNNLHSPEYSVSGSNVSSKATPLRSFIQNDISDSSLVRETNISILPKFSLTVNGENDIDAKFSVETPRSNLVYPQLRGMSDDELLSAAIAARIALGKSDKVSDRSVKVTTVQKLMRRLHPDWDTTKIGVESQRVMSGAQKFARRIREDIDRGVSDSLVLEHLPSTMREQFGSEMRQEAREGARIGAFGVRANAALEERQARLVEDAVRVQTGLDAGAIENAFGINLSETIMHLADNPLTEKEKPQGATGTGEGESEDGQAELGQEEAPSEIDAKVKAVVDDIVSAAGQQAGSDEQNRKNRKAAAGRDAENKAAMGESEENGDEGSVPADTSAGEGGDALAAAVAKEALNLENPRHLARFVAELARRQWIQEHHLAKDAEVWRDLVAVQFLRRTAQSVYSKLVRDLTYSRSRETAMGRIAKLDNVPTVAGLLSEMEFVGALVNANRIRETKKELCSKLDKFLKREFGAHGRFAPDKEEGARKVSAEAELRARYMRKCMWFTPEKAADEAAELQKTIDSLSVDFTDAGRDRDQSREFVETIRKLNVLREFGALRHKPVGEIEAAVQWWQDFARGESDDIVREMSDRDIRTKKAAHLLAVAFADPTRTTIREGGKADALNRFITGHMGFISLLQDCMRHASDADAAAVKDIIDYISREIQKSGDRSEAEKRSHNDAFHSAVEGIYGRKFNAVMKDMMAPDERFTKFMGVVGGKRVTPTKGRALQLLVSLLQEGRKVQVEDEDNPGQMKTVWEGGYHDNIVKHHREGQAAEIMRLLDPADLNMLKWLGQWYENNRSDLSGVCHSLFGIGVYAEQPNYFPVKMQLETQGLEKGNGVGWTIFPKALTPRVRNERDFDTSADIFSMWTSRMEEAAQWKHHAQLGLELRGIFGRSELREAVRANHGASVDDLMQGFITDILAGHGAYDRSTAGVQYFSDQIRGWTALCALGGNVGVMAKQTTSIPAFGFEIGLVNTAKYMVSAFTPEGMAAMRRIWDSEQRRTRWQVGSSEAVRNALSQQGAGALKRMFQASMITNKLGDAVPALVVGQGIYRDCLARGMSEEDAMAETWSLVERTQQSGRMENQTSIQRRNKLGRIMFQFLSTQQQYLQYEMRAIREVIARPDSVKRWGNLGRAILLNHFILSSAYYWMGQLYKYALGQEPPEDELKDWVITCLLGPYGSLFVAGFCCKYTLERAIKGYSIKGGSSMLPMESWLKNQINDGAKLLEAIFDSDGDTWDNMLEAAGRWMSDSNSTVRDLRKIYRYRVKGKAYAEREERREKRRAKEAREK